MQDKDPERDPARILAYVCHLHHERMRSLLSAIGVYRGQPPVLFHLNREDGLSHAELAERMHLQPATVTKMITRMEKRGLVTRQPDPDDKRISRVYMTEQGRIAYGAAHEVFTQLSGEIFAGFDEQEREQLRDMLFRVRDNLLRMSSHE